MSDLDHEVTVGRFATYVYGDGAWGGSPEANPQLFIEVHDSDIATVRFTSPDGADGFFYLGDEPARYFDDPAAGAPVDARAETGRFATWAREVLAVNVAPELVRPLLADPTAEQPVDVFVEETVVKLLQLVRLPPPSDLLPPVEGLLNRQLTSQDAVSVVNELGHTYAEPTDELLLELVRRLAPDNRFLIVQRLDAPNDEFYAQARFDRFGRYDVEYRNGSAAEHYATVARSPEAVVAVLGGWAAQRPGWHDLLPWDPIDV